MLSHPHIRQHILANDLPDPNPARPPWTSYVDPTPSHQAAAPRYLSTVMPMRIQERLQRLAVGPGWSPVTKDEVQILLERQRRRPKKRSPRLVSRVLLLRLRIQPRQILHPPSPSPHPHPPNTCAPAPSPLRLRHNPDSSQKSFSCLRKRPTRITLDSVLLEI
jgi:hypothetical protein